MPERIGDLKFQNNRRSSWGGSVHCIHEYTTLLRTKCGVTFNDVVTKENIYQAWNDFIRGKRKRPDVNTFAFRLADNIDGLSEDLTQGTYTHGAYDEYTIYDPKKRVIHKASVLDRVVHRLVYNALYPYFDKRFLDDSYSCRVGKGTHKARDRFRTFANRVSHNHTKPCHILKFDIKKCFESVNQNILKELLHQHITDNALSRLLEIVIDSFGKGLPLGNLTSQLFINIYLHELDHFVKRTLKVHHYIRYADDVVIVFDKKEELESIYLILEYFLKEKLHLTTHKKVVTSVYSGVDVLGEVFFASYKRLRRSTEKRIKIKKATPKESLL
jgi:retron-type reverse transcriptase